MIRRIRPEDREIYLRMAWDFYHSDAVLHPVPYENLTASFDEMMRSDAYMTGWIFEWEGNTAGYALLCKTWSQEAGGRAVWIDEIYMLPEYRGRGIGRWFFSQLKEIEPAARYRLEIEPENIRAKTLYEAMGFTELGYQQLVMDIARAIEGTE